ncbi:peptidyl-prolyl cis-trans isomerase CYP21-4 [Cucumis melo var. makuwa]|uniref:Peptidyl-prolyl cis-trans isomerase n=2 Tax=Cucumis melo TaxID=3656 RepID=A0A1S3BRL5_CUCME|nr:peptidyl-prolyl cis-trans isomerase CYP21-4 [Cucumis melo]KAA0046702.1 peptidyl-prolyl cis-trans isomerase CYP21-4 [Cucumis melo var. makuwa]TYK18238.1 peptidyl-prolyl cis-trans isomerase CYP21-4 [Cucumis melo var. makuwa]
MAKMKPQALLQQSKKKKGPSRISLTTILTCSLIVALFVFFLHTSYRHWSHRSKLQLENGFSGSETEASLMDAKKSDLPGYAVFSTSKGTIVVELYKESAPEVVDEFIDLCQKNRFSGMLFHHVIKHYSIQVGNSQDLGVAEDWILGGKHHSQPDASLKHDAFLVGTPRGKPKNKGFEIFITTAPIPDLSEKLIIFGQVIKGEHVVQEIEEVDTDEHYRPKSTIKINNITLRMKI